MINKIIVYTSDTNNDIAGYACDNNYVEVDGSIIYIRSISPSRIVGVFHVSKHYVIVV